MNKVSLVCMHAGHGKLNPIAESADEPHPVMHPDDVVYRVMVVHVVGADGAPDIHFFKHMGKSKLLGPNAFAR